MSPSRSNEASNPGSTGSPHDPAVLRSRFRGCLVGVAVGDALGAPFEGAHEVSDNDWRKVAEGEQRLRFTDDTHMTFGVIESLLGQEGFDGDNMARIFVRDYNSEPWRGYGAGPPQVFAAIEAGACWDEAARSLYGGRGSFGNGAAMRVAPIGLRYFTDLAKVAEVARSCAAITHAHELGMDGAAAQACGVAVAVSSGAPLDRDGFIDRIQEQVEVAEMREAIEAVRSLPVDATPGSVADRVGNGIEAVEAVPAALAAFLSNADSFTDTIAFAIALGGDTDTIASMAGALSGTYLGEDAIPPPWRERAEGARSMGRLGDILFDHATAPLHAEDRFS